MASSSTFTPILTATPSAPPTYNVGMAETFSWVPVEGAGRPLFARATYLANPEDIKISLSATNINVSLDELELNTDNIEELVDITNNSLTAFKLETDINFERTNTLLEVLTSTQYESVSLLHALTANTDDLEELVIENNTLLNSLTALTQNEFDETQTLLTNEFHSLTALTQNEFDETQTLLTNKFDSLTALTQSEFNDTQTLLDSLTALQEDKQNQIVTLLHQLTANTDSLEVNTDGVELLLSGTNVLLNALTAVDYATATKQDSIITLLDSLTAKQTTINLDVSAINLNTDEIEGLIKTSNTLLDALTAKQTVTDVTGIETRLDVLTAVDYATSTKQNESNSLLSGLTAIQVDKQDQIITLLHAITGTAIEVELTADQIDLHVDDVETLLHDLTATNVKVPGFSIPPYDEISLDYYGSTNNLSNVIYKNETTSVLSLSFVYIPNPPTSNDALLASVKKI